MFHLLASEILQNDGFNRFWTFTGQRNEELVPVASKKAEKDSLTHLFTTTFHSSKSAVLYSHGGILGTVIPSLETKTYLFVNRKDPPMISGRSGESGIHIKFRPR